MNDAMNVCDLQLQTRLGRATEAQKREERNAWDADFADERRHITRDAEKGEGLTPFIFLLGKEVNENAATHYSKSEDEPS